MITEQRHSREFWESTCEEFEKSGMAKDLFARSHGLKPQTLQWWISTLRCEKRKTRAGTEFLPVEIATDSASAEARHGCGDAVEIVLVSGTTVRVPTAADTTRIKDLLRAVVEAGC